MPPTRRNSSNRKPSGSRAAIYARISRPRIEDDTAGVDRQVAACQAHADEHGFDIVGVYVDNTQSAMTGKRPEYHRLLADVEAGLIDAVLVWSADRLYRKLSDLETLVDTLAATRVVTLKSGDIDLTTADGRMVARLLGTVAQREAEKMSERISEAAQKRATQGRKPGGERRFGYTVDGRALVPGEAALVRDAVARVIAGESLASIAREWKAKGVTGSRTGGGGTFTGVSVGSLLRKAHYAGLSTYHGKVVGTLQGHPPIITPEQHHQLVAILDDPRRKKGRGRPGSTLLGELLTCGVCGTRMAAQSRKRADGTLVPTYSCRAGHVTRGREELDSAIGSVLVEYLSGLAGKKFTRVKPDNRGASKAEAEAAKLREKLLAMPALLAGDDGMDPVDYAAAVRALRERLTVVESGLARSSATPVTALLVAAQDVGREWQGLPVQKRRTVVREVIDSVVVDRRVSRIDPVMTGVTVAQKVFN